MTISLIHAGQLHQVAVIISVKPLCILSVLHVKITNLSSNKATLNLPYRMPLIPAIKMMCKN